jgi:hypothetical protein
VSPATLTSTATVELDTASSMHAVSVGRGRRTVAVTTEAAAALFAAGVRWVRVPEPVDLAAPAAVPVLTLLRDLTALGVSVDWEVLAPHGFDWVAVSHLYPPRAVLGDPTGVIQPEWERQFYVGRLVYRRGPGFVQVRDRRRGRLQLHTIDEPDHLLAVEQLLLGHDPAALPPAVLDDFHGADLLGMAGDVAWWLPYRARRWPRPPMVV